MYKSYQVVMQILIL